MENCSDANILQNRPIFFYVSQKYRFEQHFHFWVNNPYNTGLHEWVMAGYENII